MNKQDKLKTLPGVDSLLEAAQKDDRFLKIPRKVILDAIRTSLDQVRREILGDKETDTSPAPLLAAAARLAAALVHCHGGSAGGAFPVGLPVRSQL